MNLPRWLRWRSDAELDEELQAHLEAEVAAGIERGLSPEEARYAARRALGNTTQTKETLREGDPLAWVAQVGRDLRYVLRALRRNAGFTIGAILSLALGIGANTAVFSFLDGVMFRPLDVPRPSELVRVVSTSKQERFDNVSHRDYKVYRDRNKSLSGMVGLANAIFTLKSDPAKAPQVFYGQLVTGNYFDVLEVKPMLGRTFHAEDDAAGTQRLTAVLTYRMWNARFARDPDVVGSTITINQRPVTVIGVMGREFTGTAISERPELFIPLAPAGRLFPTAEELRTDERGGLSLRVFGRLRPGAGVDAAQAEFATMANALAAAYPETNRERGVAVMEEVASRFEESPDDREAALGLTLVMGLVLLIACANVANLLLGRASTRVREFGIRLSLGAGRGRLMAQLLTESLVLAAMGTAAGVLLAAFAIGSVAAIQLPGDLPLVLDVRLDGRVLAYAVAAMAASVMLFGLWPAVRATRQDLMGQTKGATEAPRRWRFAGRYLLVGTQTAMAALLLVMASLFLQSFLAARTASPGFRVDGLELAMMDPELAGLTQDQARTYYRQLQDRLRTLPGVRAVAVASHVPLSPISGSQLVARGDADPADRSAYLNAMYTSVSPDYFTVLETPILRGRPIDARDTQTSPRVVVVNETLARQFWPEGEALGQRIRIRGVTPEATAAEVVGVAADAKYDELDEAPRAYLYVANEQFFASRLTLALRTDGDPEALAPVLREEVRAMGPDVALFGVQSMREQYERYALLGNRLLAQVVSVAGLIGFSLGVVGLYAVVAFAVSRRTREIGIRMALGAAPGKVLRGVLGSGLKVTLAGAMAGLAGAYWIAGQMADTLIYIDPHDPATFAVVGCVLMAVALAACFTPARRAARVDPAITLREEA